MDRVYLSSELAQKIVPKEVVSGVNLSTLTGILHVKDNVSQIVPCDDKDDSGIPYKCPSREDLLKKVKYEYGNLDIELFMKKLQQDGITDARLERSTAGQTSSFTITIPSEDTVVKIEENSTHIICGGKQSLRLKLRDFLMKCIQNF